MCFSPNEECENDVISHDVHAGRTKNTGQQWLDGLESSTTRLMIGQHNEESATQGRLASMVMKICEGWITGHGVFFHIGLQRLTVYVYPNETNGSHAQGPQAKTWKLYS